MGGDQRARKVTTKRRLLAFNMLIAVLLATACTTSRPEAGYLLPFGDTGSISTDHSILVATTRQRDSRPGTYFNGERAAKLNYAEIVVAVPQSHVAGEIELPSNAPGNPKSDFVVEEAAYLESEKEFIDTLNSELSKRPPGSRKVLLFIHGYNTMFAEGLYRFTQIAHDSKTPAVPVLFTWASRGKLAQYVYDNNSATAARDDLDRTLRLLFASDVDQVNILAHSMGNWVTVEALRQIKMSGRMPPMDKLGAVILAAPDIDIDVFKSQMRAFGKPAKPFYIVLSKDDKALRASNLIAGGQARLGADDNTAELAALGAVVVDMTEVKASDSANHGKFAVLAGLGPELSSVLAGGIGDSPTLPAQNRDAVGGPIGAIVTAPVSILGGTMKIISNR